MSPATGQGGSRALGVFEEEDMANWGRGLRGVGSGPSRDLRGDQDMDMVLNDVLVWARPTAALARRIPVQGVTVGRSTGWAL